MPVANGPVSDTVLRLFLALPLHEAFLPEVTQTVEILRSRIDGVKWTDPRQFHLTVHFFGDTPASRVGVIEQAMGRILSRFVPMNIRLTGLGGFPDLKRPRVIWLGVDEGTGALSELQKAVQEDVERLGLDPEARPFQPHATLGRLKGLPAGASICEGLREIKLPVPTVTRTVSRVVLYQSRLFPSGPRYEILKDFPSPSAS